MRLRQVFNRSIFIKIEMKFLKINITNWLKMVFVSISVNPQKPLLLKLKYLLHQYPLLPGSSIGEGLLVPPHQPFPLLHVGIGGVHRGFLLKREIVEYGRDGDYGCHLFANATRHRGSRYCRRTDIGALVPPEPRTPIRRIPSTPRD